MVNSTRHAVNIVILDRLVSEALVSDGPALACIRQIRSMIELGLVHEAIRLIEEKFPRLFEADSRYRFALDCQQFQEMSQSRSREHDQATIDFLKRELAPKAMESFDPDAFVSFKSLLKNLVRPIDPSGSSLELERKSIASSVYHACLQLQPLEVQHQAYKPLVQLLVYLCRIYLSAAAPPSILLSKHEEQMRDLTARILPFPVIKDAGPLPSIIESGSEVKEAEVQALIQCCGCSRREAVEAISRSNLVSALRSELSRIRIDSKLVQELLMEYSEARGLPLSAPCEEKGASSSSSSSVRQNLLLHSPPRSQSRCPPQKVMRSSPKDGPGAAFDLSALKELGRTNRADLVESVVEDLAPGYFVDRHEVLFEFRSCRFTQLMKEGRHSEAFAYSRSQLSPLASETPSLQASLQQVSSAMMPSLLSSSIVSQTGSSKFQSLLSSLINDLHLYLKRQVVNPLQSPSVTTNTGSSQRQPKMEADVTGDKNEGDADHAATRLVNLLDFLLANHSSWCAKERFPHGNCPFFLALGINHLREAEAEAGPRIPRSARSSRDSQASDEEYSLPGNEEDADAEGNNPDEDSILRIMEVLELPRSSAIDLLTLYGGDPEAAIYAVFG